VIGDYVIDGVTKKVIFGVNVKSGGKLDSRELRKESDEFGYMNGLERNLRWFGFILCQDIKLDTMVVRV
jgi:hypothetical protein